VVSGEKGTPIVGGLRENLVLGGAKKTSCLKTRGEVTGYGRDDINVVL